MNYPNNIRKNYQKKVEYGNRGMDLENLINIANERYIDEDIAIIYKKPTPIGIVKCDYSHNKILEAYYKSPSTLDYNGIYKGLYIEFDAKNTNKISFPLANIAEHQILHIKRIINHGGIIFLLIMINNKCYILSGRKLLEFMTKETRKSIPFEYIKQNGIQVEYNYLKGVDYIKGLDKLIEGEMENE